MIDTGKKGTYTVIGMKQNNYRSNAAGKAELPAEKMGVGLCWKIYM